nr:glycosyltransferase family 1 protein [Candidatus Bathyarchaeota archaeon]
MRILIVTPEYPPKHVGGGGIVYRSLAKEFKRVGHDVTVLAGDFHNRSLMGGISHVNDDGVDIFFLPLVPAPRMGNMNLVTCTPPTALAFAFLAYKIVKGGYDIIHLHGVGHPLVDIAAILCIVFRKRYVFTCHGIPKSPESAGLVFHLVFKAYLALLERFVVGKAKALTAVSHSLLEECVRKGLISRRMVVVPNGPNPDLNSVEAELVEKVEGRYSLTGKKLIFSVGRLAQTKGFQYLIRAMPYVISKIPDAIAVIAGTGPYRSELEKLVNEGSLQHHVKLVGWISEEEKAAFYQLAQVVVIPSTYEPFGIIVLEALTMHKPIIAFNISPISEMINNGVNGLLVPSGNVEKLADAILQILSNSNLRRRLASNTYSVSSFQWEDAARKYLH